MLKNKKSLYKKAYTELNEIFKIMTEDELSKIPKQLIMNIQKEMDKEYVWQLDKNKGILEQELMTETKALIVEIYKRYLCPENEKKMWEEYNCICLTKIEEKRKREYNLDNIFKKRKVT